MTNITLHHKKKNDDLIDYIKIQAKDRIITYSFNEADNSYSSETTYFNGRKPLKETDISATTMKDQINDYIKTSRETNFHYSWGSGEKLKVRTLDGTSELNQCLKDNIKEVKDREGTSLNMKELHNEAKDIAAKMGDTKLGAEGIAYQAPATKKGFGIGDG